MRLDEMIIKANADGKTYFNSKDDVIYSAENGFIGDKSTVVWVDDWEEKPKRHLTVSEAEKELDCEIDMPDISKLFKPMSEPPDDARNVIIVSRLIGRNTKYCGFYECGSWKWYGGNNTLVDILDSSRWIDPADLIKLLPKE